MGGGGGGIRTSGRRPTGGPRREHLPSRRRSARILIPTFASTKLAVDEAHTHARRAGRQRNAVPVAGSRTRALLYFPRHQARPSRRAKPPLTFSRWNVEVPSRARELELEQASSARLTFFFWQLISIINVVIDNWKKWANASIQIREASTPNQFVPNTFKFDFFDWKNLNLQRI